MNSSDIGLNKNCCNAARSFYRLNVIDNLPDIFVNELVQLFNLVTIS